MNELNTIATKWQKKWEEEGAFEADPNDKPKFFATFPYPYINAYQHIGHLFTLMRTETFSRYKRLRGHNALFAQGWHATGSPIINAAKRVKDREVKQIKIMKDQGFSDDDIKKFEKPEYWVEFFAPEFEKDYKRMGMSVDWRRKFVTTSLNPTYDKFIRWQFRKLKERGYVIQGKFPVVWDPKEGCPVGDHARVEGEGEAPQEMCLFKFKLDDNRYLITATLRPDTSLGITNVFINPKETYSEIEYNDERWIIGKPMIEKLKMQEFDVKEVGEVKGDSIVGKEVETLFGDKVPVIPATFLDSNFGSGIVHSVPSDSADDLIALQDIQKDDEFIKKYNLDAETIKRIKPIPIFNTPEIGDNAAEHFLKKYNVKSQNERGKLDKIKKELYTLTFNKSTFNEKYEKGFSKNLKGTLVKEGQDIIKNDLLKQGKIHLFYELTGKVVSRTLTECVVKIVDDQWFLNYRDPKWKKLAHDCLKKMNMYPEKARAQFEYVIDWLHEWACTREEGLGTKLPWDEKWLIESLSDSTIYMAYYTIAHLITKLPIEKIDDKLFDYLFLDASEKPEGLDNEILDNMKQNFEYFYPMDFRNSGKDLIQNHLTFCIFNHVAIFPEKHWPKGFGTNGWVTVDGQKMSKSLGNMIPVREMAEKFSPDASRITILNGGEELDDPNWDTDFARSMVSKLISFKEFCLENYDKFKRTDIKQIDLWFESEINRVIKETTDAYEATLFRSAIQLAYFEMQKILKHYMKRANDDPNKDLLNKFIEAHSIMLSPIIPHICEEVWEGIGKKEFISFADWPECDESKIDKKIVEQENLIINTMNDVRNIIKLLKSEVKKVILYVIPPEKQLFLDNQSAFTSMGLECQIFSVNDKEIYDPEGKAKKAKPGKPAIFLE